MAKLNPAEAVVVGAGVSGLSTAIRLQESGSRVTILSEQHPLETTSAVAAALWYPYLAAPREKVLQWGARTLEVFAELKDDRTTGVVMRSGFELHRAEVDIPWWAQAVPGLALVGKDEVPAPYMAGYRMTLPVIDMSVYLPWLLDRYLSQGGVLVNEKVSTLALAPLVFNCTGVGAQAFSDVAVVPVRGQVVVVENPGLENFYLDELHPEGVTYIVPRAHDCVLGGTAEAGEDDMTPSPAAAESILARCQAIEPRITGAQVLAHKVGLRPSRYEVRVEAEKLPDGTVCVHNYGHGGAGVTLSWGCAEDAVGLAHETL